MNHRVLTNGILYKVQERISLPDFPGMDPIWQDTGFTTTDKKAAIKERDMLELDWEVVE